MFQTHSAFHDQFKPQLVEVEPNPNLNAHEATIKQLERTLDQVTRDLDDLENDLFHTAHVNDQFVELYQQVQSIRDELYETYNATASTKGISEPPTEYSSGLGNGSFNTD